VGVLDGQVVEVGGYGPKRSVGKLVDNTTVTVGEYSSAREVGRVGSDRHTILRTGIGLPDEAVGDVDDEGRVFIGTDFRREQRGRVDPPHPGAAACLVLLVLLSPLPTEATEGRADREGTTQGDGGEAAARAAGVAAGVAGAAAFGVVRSVAARLRAKGAVENPDAEFPKFDSSARDSAYGGEDARSDAEAERILRYLRTFVDADTTDGEGGLSWAWHNSLIKLSDLRQTCVRFTKMRELVKHEAPRR
jgi:hypothetical protein